MKIQRILVVYLDMSGLTCRGQCTTTPYFIVMAVE
jgi:hypothetical protein